MHYLYGMRKFKYNTLSEVNGQLVLTHNETKRVQLVFDSNVPAAHVESHCEILDENKDIVMETVTIKLSDDELVSFSSDNILRVPLNELN